MALWASLCPDEGFSIRSDWVAFPYNAKFLAVKKYFSHQYDLNNNSVSYFLFFVKANPKEERLDCVATLLKATFSKREYSTSMN